jgi:hypothetical protein
MATTRFTEWTRSKRLLFIHGKSSGTKTRNDRIVVVSWYYDVIAVNRNEVLVEGGRTSSLQTSEINRGPTKGVEDQALQLKGVAITHRGMLFPTN